MAGPLSDIRIIELAGLGALPYGTLRLADMGADVVRVDRLADVPPADERDAKPYSSWDRGRRSIAVDLKHPTGVETVLEENMIISIHPHVVTLDDENCLYMQETFRVTPAGGEQLSSVPIVAFDGSERTPS